MLISVYNARMLEELMNCVYSSASQVGCLSKPILDLLARSKEASMAGLDYLCTDKAALAHGM